MKTLTIYSAEIVNALDFLSGLSKLLNLDKPGYDPEELIRKDFRILVQPTGTGTFTIQFVNEDDYEKLVRGDLH